MTDAELEEAKRLCDAATPGEWSHATESRETKYERVYVGVEDGPGATVSQWANPRDAAFIAASRQLVPRLIAALESTRRERDDLADKLMTSERQFDAIGLINEANVLLAEQRDAARAEAEQLRAERDALPAQISAWMHRMAEEWEAKKLGNNHIPSTLHLFARDIAKEAWRTTKGDV